MAARLAQDRRLPRFTRCVSPGRCEGHGDAVSAGTDPAQQRAAASRLGAGAHEANAVQERPDAAQLEACRDDADQFRGLPGHQDHRPTARRFGLARPSPAELDRRTRRDPQDPFPALPGWRPAESAGGELGTRHPSGASSPQLSRPLPAGDQAARSASRSRKSPDQQTRGEA